MVLQSRYSSATSAEHHLTDDPAAHLDSQELSPSFPIKQCSVIFENSRPLKKRKNLIPLLRCDRNPPQVSYIQPLIIAS